MRLARQLLMDIRREGSRSHGVLRREAEPISRLRAQSVDAEDVVAARGPGFLLLDAAHAAVHLLVDDVVANDGHAAVVGGTLEAERDALRSATFDTRKSDGVRREGLHEFDINVTLAVVVVGETSVLAVHGHAVQRMHFQIAGATAAEDAIALAGKNGLALHEPLDSCIGNGIGDARDVGALVGPGFYDVGVATQVRLELHFDMSRALDATGLVLRGAVIKAVVRLLQVVNVKGERRAIAVLPLLDVDAALARKEWRLALALASHFK